MTEREQELTLRLVTLEAYQDTLEAAANIRSEELAHDSGVLLAKYQLLEEELRWYRKTYGPRP